MTDEIRVEIKVRGAVSDVAAVIAAIRVVIQEHSGIIYDVAMRDMKTVRIGFALPDESDEEDVISALKNVAAVRSAAPIKNVRAR